MNDALSVFADFLRGVGHSAAWLTDPGHLVGLLLGVTLIILGVWAVLS